MSRVRGFTLIELLVALTLGVVILGAAIGYLLREMRTLTGGDIRQSVARNGRYVGVSLRHDLQRAGVGIKSTTSFGTAVVWPGSPGDTLVVLYVPYTPELAPAHPLVPPIGASNPLPPGGTCGPRCVEVVKGASQPLELAVGDLARLQILETRRLILISDLVETSDTSVAITFNERPTILRQPAGLVGGLRLDLFGTFVQELTPVVYYLDENAQLLRAPRLDLNGSPDGDVLAYGVERFDVTLVFSDGDELERADPSDEDDSNDYDDIVAVRAVVTIRADRSDPRVNEGELFRRRYEWLISPRNLRYERNRI
ncbi:MAG: prepilin-type N-terminal cleavage/methylation domain-containing protein [Gemmatimonadota bacterium]|nr:MAG: prepilin-type N-terminal cleavage/methylation domain-containing protein [Gemmatimonadota bacterium]